MQFFIRGRCKFPTAEVIGAQNFNFVSNFSRMWVFMSKFCISGRKLFDT